GGKLFCAHGGVSAGTMTRHELRLLRKPIMDVGNDQLLTDILWADPTRGTDGSVCGYEGTEAGTMLLLQRQSLLHDL
ncbi:hypothetical protein PMAYCL1PPCAC_04130, partial [Pristionchus mayeri]